jgi:hypothetical protein
VKIVARRSAAIRKGSEESNTADQWAKRRIRWDGTDRRPAFVAAIERDAAGSLSMDEAQLTQMIVVCCPLATNARGSLVSRHPRGIAGSGWRRMAVTRGRCRMIESGPDRVVGERYLENLD